MIEQTKEDRGLMYTEDELMARLKFFIGVCLTLTLFGIVFVVLYSIIFVTQPLNAISPIDQKFFELIIPIATFLTGTLSGIMLAGKNPDAQMKALEAANKGWDKPPAPSQTFSQTTTTTMGPGGMQRSMSSSVSNPLADATSLPVFEAGDPTHRNMRNDY
jgi:hypothetical protein